jgi:hypothetical protein
MATVGVAGRDHERGSVGGRVGEVADGIAEAGRGVDVDEGGPSGGLGVAVGHGDNSRLLQRQDVVEVLAARSGQRIEQGQLGRTRVAEDVPDTFRCQHRQQHVAAQHGRRRYPNDRR